jgi:hypothetical protein
MEIQKEWFEVNCEDHFLRRKSRCDVLHPISAKRFFLGIPTEVFAIKLTYFAAERLIHDTAAFRDLDDRTSRILT